ncbi:ribonuclease Z [Kwoniella heveanensis CBS 569]|nr:ribonuclease Z [Kwoniella heveanensis CBS 569]
MIHHKAQVKPKDRVQAKPPPPVSVTFLGTSSGGGPILSRNCSSLAVDFGQEIWVVDAADGTLMRLHQSSIRIANITRLFITHMHADHVLGIVAILMTIMSGVGNQPGDVEKTAALGLDKKPTFNIYGPVGVRKLIRTTLQLTSVNLSGVYAVHELMSKEEENKPSVGCGVEELHANEAVGMDLVADKDGVWRDVLVEGNGRSGKGWGVSAGPIHHRVPAVGYVLQEPTPRLPLDTAALIPLLQSNAAALASLDPPIKHPLSLLSYLTSLPPPKPYTLPSGETLHPPAPSGIHPRRLVIFGDCSGGTENPTFERMCNDASLLVHECTNAAIPGAIQRGQKGMGVRTRELEPSLEKKREKQFHAVWHPQKQQQQQQHSPDSNNHKRKAAQQGDVQGADETPGEVLSKDELNRQATRKKALGRGHSTPDEVGTFARKINANRVVVNHFSAMFPSGHYVSTEPFPSILSPISPYPYPTPQLPPSGSGGAVPERNLTSAELHTRVILQSIADQITHVWTGVTGGVRTPNAHGQQNGTMPKNTHTRFPSESPNLEIDDGDPDANGHAQVNTNEKNDEEKSGHALPGESKSQAHSSSASVRQAITARDFMVLNIPSHELSKREEDDIRRYKEEADRVTKEWSEKGGMWVSHGGGGKGDQGKRVWLGTSTE